MFKMGLAASEQAIVVCNGDVIHNIKPLDESSMLKTKKKSKIKNQKVQFGTC